MPVFLLAALLPLAGAAAGTVRLDGTADGDTTYIEQPSDGFIRLDLYDPPPRETQQRFHSIQDPSVTYGSLAYDGFPNDADFRLGVVTFDESGLVGGTGVAPVTNLLLGVGTDPTDSGHYNYYRWLPTNTSTDNVSGTVTLLAGVVVSIDLTADMTLSINPFGSIFLHAPGTFSVVGNRFEGHAEVATSPNPNSLLIWDFSGTLNTVVVPEPTSAVLAGAGFAALACGCLGHSRRRQRKGIGRGAPRKPRNYPGPCS